MKIDYIDKIINRIIKECETRDPYEIAKQNGIFVIEEDLGEVYGYYNSFKRRKFIHINSTLEQEKKNVTACHELGHSLCHPLEKTPALTKMNLVSELKIEKEANYFATKLIVDDRHKEQNMETVYSVLDFYGLPTSFERYL
ncbi:ImmA/IrrE family metallo-endopeptidase [Enterococcus italicus]|uniref:ImmA/IrrE family metallo-endopeptidase n=1 Tax=Enterococcus italicus TaxID=246144 RepID=UPI0020749836|nr:ImmA/IrrE family metallo-endopeptidase [Enterococcus italicus]